MLLVAHRGAPTRATENTLRSILIGQAMKADAVEFDVWSTRDGVPVVVHDKTLERFWGCNERVDEVDLSAMRKLTTRFADGVTDTIPTFEEVVAATTLQLIIDCKSPTAIPAIVGLLRDLGEFGRSKFVGHPSIMEVVRKTVPGAQIVMSWAKPEPPPRDLLDKVEPNAINLKWTPESATAYERIAALGYPVWVWTIDDADNARRARDAGVAAIISNDLETIVPALAA
jgi:glycerophosphoryl diester phosphodiesterase